jgi:imidazolonepropionase-like amidohydrolase
MWLLPDRCIDGDGTSLPIGTAIRIEGGTIAELGPPKAEPVRLSHCSLLPGFVDAHDYLSVDPDRPNPMGQMFSPDTAARRATALSQLARDLAAGITTLRVMGEGTHLDIALRREAVPGPSLLCAGVPVAPPGSHQAPPGGGCATEAEIVAAVAANAAAGADWIKLVVTGGVNAKTFGPTESPWGRAEIRAGIQAARAAGLPVAVAAHGGEPLVIAAEEGAASIEHGAFLDQRGIDAMAANGVAWVPTFGRFFRKDGIELSAHGDAAVLAQLNRARAALQAALELALARPLVIALGGDNMHGRQAWDAGFLAREAGPAAGIAALTGGAAAALGLADRGFLRVGQRADLVAVDGDPLAEMDALLRVRGVWRGGKPEMLQHGG